MPLYNERIDAEILEDVMSAYLEIYKPNTSVPTAEMIADIRGLIDILEYYGLARCTV